MLMRFGWLRVNVYVQLCIFIVKTAMIKKPRPHNTGARLESNDREGLLGILGQVIRDHI